MYSTHGSSDPLFKGDIILSIFSFVVTNSVSIAFVIVQLAEPYRTAGLTIASNNLALALNGYDLERNTSLYLSKAAHPAQSRLASSVAW